MRTLTNILSKVSLVLLIGLGSAPGHTLSGAQDPQNVQAQDAQKAYKNLVERIKGGDFNNGTLWLLGN